MRVIARLDVKTTNLVKGIRLEGLRKLGPPNAFSKRYYCEGVDEILYVDIVASLYERNSLTPIIREASADIFIPLTVTGGVRNVENAIEVLSSGADKVGINTGAVKRPALISEISDHFGSQCMVASIEAKSLEGDKWEVYYDNGREKTGIDVIEWAREVEERGAGEILLTSVDQEGTGKGMDLNLIANVCDNVGIPVIASGGVGNLNHLVEGIKLGKASAVLAASIFHYGKHSIKEAKEYLDSKGIPVRI